MSKKQQQNKFKEFIKDIANEANEFPAFMGNRTGTVRADMKNNSWIMDMSGNEMIIRNTRVPNQWKLAVIVGRDPINPTLLQVLRMRDSYINPPYPTVAEHAYQMHNRWDRDPVWVENTQLLSGLATPTSSTGFIVTLRGFNYYMNGWHTLNNTTIDFEPELPASGAIWVVADVDDTETITLRAGTPAVASREVLYPSDIPLTIGDKKSLFAVKMYVGQQRIIYHRTDSDIFDMRFGGVASGGIATSVEWDSILNKPATWDELWAELTGVVAGVIAAGETAFPRKWYKSAPPTANDDSDAGYSKLDLWVDTSSGFSYICIIDAVGAAFWFQNGAGSASLSFAVDGKLAVKENASTVIVFTTDSTVDDWTFFIENKGTAGTTILDVHYFGGASIFTTQGNRPSIAFDATENFVAAIADVLDFPANTVLELHIDEIADGAGNAVLVGRAGGGGSAGGTGLTITDGVTTVNNVGLIRVPAVVNDGGGEVSLFNDYICVRDEKAQNTAGGTFTSGAWQTRTINTESSDTGGHCSIGSNQITLASGTYIASIKAPAQFCATHQAKLYNITDATDVLIGTSTFSEATTSVVNHSHINGKFTIASSKVFEIQHRCGTTRATDGFGRPANFTTEVYTIAEFWKVA